MAKNKFTFKDFRVFLKDVISYNPTRALAALILSIAVGITNGINIAVLIPLLKLFGFGEADESGGFFSEFILKFFNMLGVSPTIGHVLLLFLLIFISMSFLQYCQIKSASIISNSYSAHVRKRLYINMFDAQWPFFIRSKMAHIANILTVEAQRVMVACNALIHVMSESLIVLVYILLALFISWQITTLVVCAGAVISWFMRKQIQSGRATGVKITDSNSQLQSAVWEHLGGAKIIKSYAAEEESAKLFHKLVFKISDLYVRYLVNQAKIRMIFEPVSVIILCIGLYLSLTYFHIDMAYLIVLLFIFYRLYPKITLVQQNYHKFLTAIPAYTELRSLEKEVISSPEYQEGKTKITTLKEGIEMNNVSFAYARKSGNVINAVNMSIPYGKTVALVGESGSGKSTIADMVMGLLQPGKGEILIDEVNINDLDMKNWRSFIGYVTQETVLFHDSVLANLLWANPEATEEEISNVAKIAAADAFIENLPEKIDTIIGDRGIRLSGGQRQRIALARALLRNPRLLILDEATSSLDAESEHHIQKAIESLHGRMTILVITHRLATVRNADFIYVINKGEIVEKGSWNTLARDKNGYFHSMYELQSLSHNTEDVQ